MAPSLLCWGSVVTMVWGPAKSLGSRSARQQTCSKKLLKGISTCPRLSMQTPMFVVWSSKALCPAVLCSAVPHALQCTACLQFWGQQRSP